MAYFPFQPGQQPMSSSQGVAIASDQSPVSVAGTVNVGNSPTVVQSDPSQLQASVTGTVTIGGQAASILVGGSVFAFNGTSLTPADGATNANFTVRPFDSTGTVRTAMGVAPYVFNGVNWDRLRGNSSVGALVSTANQSVITAVQGSVAVALINSVNQSVSGTVGAAQSGAWTTSVFGSVTAIQGTNPWIITGSVQATAAANQSVSGTVGASIIGLPPVNVTNTNLNVSGSVAAWLNSSSASVITAMGQDVVPATASILVGVTANTNGSVLTTTGWQGAMVQITSGPGASITGALNFEGTMDGTAFVPINGYNPTTNAISSVTTTEGNWFFNTAGFQGIRTRVSNWSVGSITARAVLSPADARPLAQTVAGSVAAAITNANVNVSGSVAAFVQGTPNVNAAGSVVAFQGTTPWTISSVYGNISGSVAAFQAGTRATSITGTLTIGAITSASSIFGNVSVFQAGTWATSMVGAPVFAEDTPSTDADKGLNIFAIRNDNVASFVSASGDYTNFAVDSAGRNLVKPFSADEGAFRFTGSTVSTSVMLIQASAIGKRSYITDFWVANTGAATTLVTFQGGDTSVVGYTIAPSGGGSNSPGIAMPPRTTLSQDLAVKATTATSVLYVTVVGYQAP